MVLSGARFAYNKYSCMGFGITVWWEGWVMYLHVLHLEGRW